MNFHENGINLVARSGYAARGIVYLIIGGLAVLAAVGNGGGKTVGSKGALATLAHEPLGGAALIVIALGLFGYALWRGVQAILDADDHGTDLKGLVIRAGLMVSAITHALLGIYAISLPFTVGAGSGGSGSKGAVAWLLHQPFGVYLLAIAGACIAGAGLAQIWKGITGQFRKRLAMHPHLMNSLSPVCAFGLSARGIVFVIIGGFILYAAYTYDPEQAGGLADALTWLRTQSYGQVLFMVIATGLLSFGAYSLIEAVWRRVDMDAATN